VSEKFTTVGAANDYVYRVDQRTKALDRKPIYKLREIWTSALAERGMTSLFGGPQSHDEFIRSILELEFPDEAEARQVRYDAAMSAEFPPEVTS
jgi:hypothetical protein